MVTLCPGTARKLALPLVGLTIVGWVVLLIGTGISVLNDEQSSSGGQSYPLYMAAIGGLFTLISLTIHPIFPRPYSVYIGAVTAFLTTLWIHALGMIMLGTANNIRTFSDGMNVIGLPDNRTVDPYLTLEFSGSLIATFFVTAVMMLWFFYDGTENFSETTTPFKGVARKLALPFIGITAIGWLLVVIGLGIGNNEDADEFLIVQVTVPVPGVPGVTVDVPMVDPRRLPFIFAQVASEPFSYPYFAAIATGPLVLIVAVLHAMTWKPVSNVIGATLVFLNTIWVTALGMLVIVNGVRIQRANNGDMYFAGTPGLPPPFDEPPDVPAHYALEFAGGIICIIFWIPVVVLWQFYDGVNGGETGSLDIKARTEASNEVKLANI